MRLTRRALAVASVASAVGVVVVACSDGPLDGLSMADGGPSLDGGGPIGVGDGGATGPTSGVLIVHAAAFPPLRLCFEAYPDLPPQPDARVLPGSNVVGVEMGGVARIGALGRAPGDVYVIDQREIAATPNELAQPTCGDLLREGSRLRRGKEYEVLGPITTPLGTSTTSALVVAGCWRQDGLAQAGIDRTGCDDVGSSLALLTLPLAGTRQTTGTTLPVELVNLSAAVTKEAPPGEHVEVTFGALDAAAGSSLLQPVASAPPLFDASATAVLDVDLGLESIYGTHGFRLRYRSDDAGGDAAPPAPEAEGGSPLSFDQSLASIQAMSREDGNPTTYFLAPSNFALLMLGDPRIRRTLADGGANDAFDARRALHFLAVPVREESASGAITTP